MLVKALLISLWAGWIRSGFTLNIGNFVLGQGVVTGTVIGVILGDPLKGMIVGATINLIYLGVISVGGTTPADSQFAAIIGTVVAITGNLTPEQALAVAVPVGVLGVYLNTALMTVSSAFPHWADRYAEEGNLNGVVWVNIGPRQIIQFFLRAVPVFLVVMYGGGVVEGAVGALPQWALDGMNTAGGMMPALGVAMLLMYMGRSQLLPFFFLGFLLGAYATKDLMMAAIIGAIAAFIYVQLMPKEVMEEIQA
jgi:PTS system mannose-specific IIC component